jgi:hypothetical protein
VRRGLLALCLGLISLAVAGRFDWRRVEAVSGPCAAVTEIPCAECEALVELYHSTGGEYWVNRNNWLTTSTPSDWFGVEVTDGHVTRLSLAYNGLAGSLPAKLGALDHLEWLDLSHNALAGSLPPSLGSIRFQARPGHKAALDLSFNQIRGELPAELGALRLRGEGEARLDLSHNCLSGPIPAAFGAIELVSDGPVLFDLSSNQIEGPLPAGIGSLKLIGANTHLKTLDLARNVITGTLPTSLGDLGAIGRVDLSHNQLSGAIPPELGRLRELHTLNLSDNNLTGSIPPELAALTWTTRLPFTLLDLSRNRLHGAVPAALGQLRGLWALDLSRNALAGELPPALIQLQDTRRLDLGYNALSATDRYLIAFLNSRAPGWQATQTLPPGYIQAYAAGASPSAPVDRTLLTWAPIGYTPPGGSYEISHATRREGPYTVHSNVPLTATEVWLDGMPAGQVHFVRVRSYTPPYGAQRNALWSDYCWAVRDDRRIVWSSEAEDGALNTPMVVYEDAGASGGRYIASTGNSQGEALYHPTLNSGGYYSLWARSMPLGYERNSFYLSLNNGPETHYELPPVDGEWAWRWRRVYSVNESEMPWLLGAGTHTLRFRGREIGTRLDSLILVRHPYEAPPPTIPAPTSTPTATPEPTATPTATPTHTPDLPKPLTLTPGAYPPMLWLPLLER